MIVRQSVADLLENHVTFELECIDRMYLNAYVPSVQSGAGFVWFLKTQLGCRVPSTAMIAPQSRAFAEAFERFARAQGVDLVTFAKGERKDDVAQRYLAGFTKAEGVLFVGKAQEKASVFRTEKRTDAQGKKYPWIVRSTAMVNHYYVYILDRDLGPLFLKFCTYFPYPAKLCLNGHEWLKRQLTRQHLRFEPLDNGLRSAASPARVQAIADQFDAATIETAFRKWLARVPHPFTPAQRAAGYRYQLSILQAEFALTQVLDRPATGRAFFEEVIRENLDVGRPDQVQLIFDRRVIRTTPGRFRTRVITEGVTPSLHVDYKASRIKQYHKEGQALRTETTINNTYDFQIGRSLSNLPALRELGFAANRRLLRVQSLSHDCLIGDDRFQAVIGPVLVDGQRAAGLRFGDRRALALLHALCLFAGPPTGFRQRDVRAHVAALQGRSLADYGPGALSYDLRRLRLHALIERIPKTHRYRVTEAGLRTALFCVRLYARAIRPALAWNGVPLPSRAGHAAYQRLEHAMDAYLKEVHLAA
jgi:hypothetical protein